LKENEIHKMSEPPTEPSQTEVHPQLYIGNIAAARQLDKSRFDTIVTTCQDNIREHVSDEHTYHYFNMSDGEPSKWGGECNYDIVANAADTVLSALERNETVLVHCHHARSRSVTVATAALAVYEDTGFVTMFERIEEKRPQVGPNERLIVYGIAYVVRNT